MTSAAGWPPAGAPNPPPGYDHGAPGPAGTAPPRLPRRGRPGLIVLIAVLVQVIIVAAAENQALTQHISKYGLDHQDTLLGRVALASLTYAWRISPATGDSMHQWLGRTVGLVSIFVLTALLMLSVIRGPITFTRAWLGTWMAVVVATGLGGIVYLLIYRGPVDTRDNERVSTAVFNGAGSYGFVAGVGLGLVVGLVAGLVAIISRRPAEIPAASPDVQGTIGSGFFAGDPRRAPATQPRDEPPLPRQDAGPAESAQSTAELPVLGDSARANEQSRQTTQLPRLGIGSGAAPGSVYGTRGPASGRDADAQQTAVLRTGDRPAEAASTGSTEPSGRATPGGRSSAGGDGAPPDDRQTTALPTGDGQPPRQFPRPPDDEDLGHIPE